MTMLAQEATIFGAGMFIHLLFLKKGEHEPYGPNYVRALIATSVFIVLVVRLRLHFSWASSLWHCARMIGLFLGGLYTSLLNYRLLFHPLNRFPGPIGSRLGDLWLTMQLTRCDMHRKTLELYIKYGPFVRIGSSTLMIVDPQAVEVVHGPQSRCLKGVMYDFEQPNLGIDSRDEQIHLARKRVWSLGFGDKALRSFEPRLAVHTKRVLSMIESAAGKAIDVTKMTEDFAFDVILDLGISDNFDMLKSVQSHKATQQFVLGRRLPMWLFHVLGRLPFFPSEDKLYDEKLDQIITDEKRGERPSIIQPLIAHFEKLPPTDRDISVIRDDGKFIIVAGSDTVAATLGFIFYFLAKHPENIGKLRLELAPLRSVNGTFARQQIQHAEHLNAVINETLRLYPPASTIQRITPSEGIMINGTFIPGGITVFTPQYVLGRLKDSFENPEDFIPERWYSRPDMIKDSSGYAPFNTGLHMCIGRPLALMELRSLVAECVSCYDISFAPGFDSDEFVDCVKDCMVWHLSKLELCFTQKS